jgi:hypothetical protein
MKIIAISLLLLPCLAFADITTFNALDFQRYCPALSDIQYNAFNEYKGTMVYTKKPSYGVFHSYNGQDTQVPCPNNLYEKGQKKSGLVTGVRSRQVDGSYGFKSGNAIHCYYTYTSWHGDYYLIMDNIHEPHLLNITD